MINMTPKQELIEWIEKHRIHIPLRMEAEHLAESMLRHNVGLEIDLLYRDGFRP